MASITPCGRGMRSNTNTNVAPEEQKLKSQQKDFVTKILEVALIMMILLQVARAININLFCTTEFELDSAN
jgi:hypothetical protein